jgi:hypothetical protein
MPLDPEIGTRVNAPIGKIVLPLAVASAEKIVGSNLDWVWHSSFAPQSRSQELLPILETLFVGGQLV